MTDTNEKLTLSEAQKVIRGIAKFGSIIPTFHIDFESGPKRSWDLQDVEAVLTHGNVTEEPVFDDEYGNWKYKVEGKAIDGDEAIVVTVILSHRELRAITIIPK